MYYKLNTFPKSVTALQLSRTKSKTFSFSNSQNNQAFNNIHMESGVSHQSMKIENSRYHLCIGHTEVKCKGKGKAISLQAWTGPEGSRRFRLPYFKTIST